MKKLIIVPLAILAAALSVAHADPPLKGSSGPRFNRAKTVESISALEKGDRYVLVCKVCESATVNEVADAAEVAGLCHNGGKIHCDGCKKDVTVTRVGPQGKKHISKVEVKYLNEEGEECMILIPLKEAPPKE